MSRNTDQNPTIDPLPGPQLPEPEVLETLPGPIGILWKSFGGLNWGIPDGKPRNIGGGQSVGFRMLTGELVGIYTSPAGTFVVSSRMMEAWRRFGGNAGALGFPASAELNAHAGGRYQHFQGGMVVWHASTGAFVVKGAILAKYTALGGSLWGYPITDEGTTAGNVGWFNHFRNVDNGGELSIYSTPQTGTVAIYGLIRQKWSAMGWERSPLGYPTQDEWTTGVDPHGRFSAFQNGYIVYHPSVGTFATFGPISARYRDLGGAAWGYPTTDVTNLNAGGQYLHLRNLGVGDDRSIYWHPSTGANEVSGQIRRKWSKLGWEKSPLGFPTEGPKPYTEPNSDPGSTAQQFQGGLLIVQPTKGTYTSPMVWTQLIDAGGFSGEVRLTASDDGTVTLGGYVRSDALAGFKYLVKATLIANNNHAVVLSDRGSVSGTHGSDEKDSLFASVQSDIVRRHFDKFAQGKLLVDHRHDNLLTGALGDVLEGVFTWGVGMLTITPGVGLVIVAGVSLGSLIGTGSLVPGAQIIAGTLWLAGPTGMIFALAAEGLVQLATEDREISDDEYAFADLVFKGSLPPQSEIRITNGTGPGDRRFTYPRFDRKILLNFGEDWQHPITSYTEDKQHDGQLFIHELTHAWQYRNNPTYLEYVADGIAGRLKVKAPGTHFTEDWTSFNIEQQATIVDRWFADYHRAGLPDEDFGLSRQRARDDDRYPYIELVRRART